MPPVTMCCEVNKNKLSGFPVNLYQKPPLNGHQSTREIQRTCPGAFKSVTNFKQRLPHETCTETK